MQPDRDARGRPSLGLTPPHDTKVLAATASEARSRRVFVSHASKDLRAAEDVYAALQGAEIPCWISSRGIAPGESWPRAIFKALEACPIVLLILSEHVNTSFWVFAEMTFAKSKDRTVIQLRLENVKLSEDLAPLLADLQSMNGFPPPLSDHLVTVCAAVAAAVERVQSALPVAAPIDDPLREPLRVVFTLDDDRQREGPVHTFVSRLGLLFAVMILIGSTLLAVGSPDMIRGSVIQLATGFFGMVGCFWYLQRGERKRETTELLRTAILKRDAVEAERLCRQLLTRFKLAEE